MPFWCPAALGGWPLEGTGTRRSPRRRRQVIAYLAFSGVAQPAERVAVNH